MSAYIVDRTDIDAIVTVAAASGLIKPEDVDQLGRVLWAENLLSVTTRYPDDPDGDRPGPIGFRDADAETYEWTEPAAKLDRRDIRRVLDRYEYQSCEHKAWADSLASAVITHLLGLYGDDAAEVAA